MSFWPFNNGKVTYVPRRALIDPAEEVVPQPTTKFNTRIVKGSALVVLLLVLVGGGAWANAADEVPASVSAPVVPVEATAQKAISATESASAEPRPIPKVAKTVAPVKPKVKSHETFTAAVVVKETVEPQKPSQKPSEAPQKAVKDEVVPKDQMEGAETTKSGSTSSKDAPKATGTGKGKLALAFAKNQLGEPYVMNADGPNSWDCSGLTMKAWAAAGVKGLPHSAHKQIYKGTRVSKSNLRPGDLVFFYSPIRHVGIYAGDGKVIHAPRPGKRVEYIPMKYMPFAGAVRPG